MSLLTGGGRAAVVIIVSGGSAAWSEDGRRHMGPRAIAWVPSLKDADPPHR